MPWHRHLLAGARGDKLGLAFVFSVTNGRSRLEERLPLLARFTAMKLGQAVGHLVGTTLCLRQQDVRCQGRCSPRVEKGQHKAACSKGEALLQCSDPRCPPHLVTVPASRSVKPWPGSTSHRVNVGSYLQPLLHISRACAQPP